MSIPAIKKNFVNIGGVHINPSMSSYNRSIITSFRQAAVVQVPRSFVNKISINPVTPARIVPIGGASPAPPTAPVGTSLLAGARMPATTTTGRTAPPPRSDIATVLTPSSTLDVTTTTPTGPTVPIIGVALTPPDPSEAAYFPESHDTIVSPLSDEAFTGRRLEDAEKPYIVATLGFDIVVGKPTKNLIFIRALNSPNKKAIKYSLMRKSLFTGQDYQTLITKAPADMTSATKYASIVQQHPELAAFTFVFEDANITNSSVYVYKIYVEWLSKTSDETRQSLISTVTPSRVATGLILG